ncbi:hypothetical protein [Sphingomonas sp. Marseille-Q8236]
MTGYRDGYDINKWHANGMKRRPRRYWVRWLLAGSTVSAVGATALAQGDHPPIFFLVLPGLFASYSPFARDTWATARGRAVYDEFERTALLTATARAFATYIGLITVLLGWLAAASQMGWPMPIRPMQWVGWLLGLLIIGVSLPATFAEFMVPMPDTEDEML